MFFVFVRIVLLSEANFKIADRLSHFGNLHILDLVSLCFFGLMAAIWL
jgi:hypothetical protein